MRHSYSPAHVQFPAVNHVYNKETGKQETLETLCNGPDKEIWTKATRNEFGWLVNGNIHGVRATNTIEIIQKDEVPNDRKITCSSFVCDHRPLKREKVRGRIVVGGDTLNYEFDPVSPAVSLLETKLLLNSAILDHKSKNWTFSSADLKDFFLATPMDQPEYMKIKF